MISVSAKNKNSAHHQLCSDAISSGHKHRFVVTGQTRAKQAPEPSDRTQASCPGSELGQWRYCPHELVARCDADATGRVCHSLSENSKLGNKRKTGKCIVSI